MNWLFWKKEMAADSMRREIEQLRSEQRQMRDQMTTLKQDNREAWEILSAIAARVEKPDDAAALFGWLRCITMKHGDKLKRAADSMRKERTSQ